MKLDINELLSDEKSIKILIDYYNLNNESKLVKLIGFLKDEIEIKDRCLQIIFLETIKSSNNYSIAFLIDYIASQNNSPQRFGSSLKWINNVPYVKKPHFPIEKMNSNRKKMGWNKVSSDIKIQKK